MSKYALTLIDEIERETGQATGYKRTGGLWLTQNHDRITELKRIAAMGEMNELYAQFMNPGELFERFPMINHTDLAGAMYLPEDGQINPVDLCMAFAKGARQRGIEIREHTGVEDIVVENGIAKAVVTDKGETIECDIVVNCAGLWSRTIGEMADVNVPLQAVEHMYVVTEPIPELPQPWPVCRDMEGALYIKEDTGKFVLGTFESNAKLWDHKSVDPKASYLIFDEDWDHIEPMLKAGINRIPAFAATGLTHFMTGAESFTPDTKQLMGRSFEVQNFFVAAGMNSLGIMSSPGVGKAMADWIVLGDSPMDLWEVDILRFQPKDNDLGFIQARVIESVPNQFDMHWPFKQFKTGRNRTQSVWYDRMAELGAVFGAPAGWERPLWFAKEGEPKTIDYSYGYQSWWPVAERESKMLQQTGAFFELSPFSKIRIEGPDACTALQWLCTNDMDVEVGRVVYTLMLNKTGGIEAELTATRLDEDTYLIITASLTRMKDMAWIKRHTTQFDLAVSDMTDDFSVLGVMGPNSRALLNGLCDKSFSDEDFSFGGSELTNLAGKPVRASRLSFVGELGWEIMVENRYANDVLDVCLRKGVELDMEMAGFMTMECCRLEKGYLHWGHEVGPEENPYQANLGFAVKTRKAVGFRGMDALQQTHQTNDRRLVLFECRSGQPLLLHDEPIYYEDNWIGRTTSGGVGYRTNKFLCFGYIEQQQIPVKNEDKAFQVKVAGEMFDLHVLHDPPYDPKGERMRR